MSADPHPAVAPGSAPGAEATVEVLLFARLRDAAGRDVLTVPWAPGTTVADVASRLQEELPQLPLRGCLCAVNERYARPEQAVAAGDRVAFLPPISGG